MAIHKTKALNLGSLLALVSALFCGTTAAVAASCESIAKLALPNTSITIAAPVAAGPFRPPPGPPIPRVPELEQANSWGTAFLPPEPLARVPAYCRVAGVIQPSSDSHIQFEVWMPISGWNGKFQGVGNGGFAGAISYMAMAVALAHGYATASTDTGHHGSALDSTWALKHPELVIDFAYRAIHETAAAAKAVIGAFYGEAPHHSYFNSCSNGGRQALMEAQRFPADYDGIIAGDPGNYWTHILAAGLWDKQMTLEPGSYISAAKLPALQAAGLAACDAIDGVKDGVIEDPERCHFDPATLLCKGPESDACLTAPQVAALKKLYAGPRNSSGGRILPGYLPGGEAEPDGWALWVTGPSPDKGLILSYSTQFFQNMVYENPAWDFRTFDLDRDTQAADRKLGAIMNATDPDLSRFKDRGGKLIIYHGWSDAALPALNTVDYYQSVVSKMGPQEAGTFIRLFMAPGMQHCGGGSGPNGFGMTPGSEGDPLHDIDAAVKHWVEDGVAPQEIIATKYKIPSKAASGAARTRPLCPYPQVARWNGTGSTDDAANFTCGKD
jgi:feruloyl esterase